MKVKYVVLFATLIGSATVLAGNWYQPAGVDLPVRNGHLYGEAVSSRGTTGFRITDDGGIPFWTEYQRLGGTSALGFPTSRRFLCNGDVCQETQHAILRWHVQDGIGSVSRVDRPDWRGPAEGEALRPESHSDAAEPDLPALSAAGLTVANHARAAVVKIEPTADSFGSGVIIDQRGYVITNKHVVDGAAKVKVSLVDGRIFEGSVLGGDENADVAVVKIEAGNLPVLALGDSSEVKAGDEIVVIGYTPLFGDNLTARTGIVHFSGRISGHSFLPETIETDAFVHPGDSGGPLLDLQGKMIGLTSSMRAPSGGSSRLLSSALATNAMKTIAEGLIADDQQ